MPLTDPTAIAAYEKTLRDTLIYRNAESFCRVRVIIHDLQGFFVYFFNHLSINSVATLSGSSPSITSFSRTFQKECTLVVRPLRCG